MSKQRKKHTTALMALCLILFFNPNFNTIDILPDFIAYLILARLAGRHADHVPYFAEIRLSCLKLAALTAIKIPAMFVMLANMSSGQDIVPLFTLIFATLELILIIPLVSYAFSAVFYIGERGNLPSAISKYKVLGIYVSPEFLRAYTRVFAVAKAVLSVIPELCLLTFDKDTSMAKMRALYPPLTVCCLLTVMLIGIVWAILSHGYVKAIARDGGIGPAAREIAGEEKLARLERERSVRRRISSVTLLFFSSILIFDITFATVNNGVNIMPRFLFALALIFISYNLFDEKAQKMAVLISGALFSIISVIKSHFLTEFKGRYEYRDLIDFEAAVEAYEPVKVWSLIEGISFLAFILAFGFALIRFVDTHTGADKSSPGYGKAAAAFARRMRMRAIIFLLFPAVIGVMKTVEVFLLANPTLIYTDAADAANPAITASAIPWFGFAIVAVCTVYVLFSYSYTTELKEEIGLKYSDEYTVF